MSESTKYDAIYLQMCDDENSEWCDTVTWCQDRVHDSDVKYIRDDLVESLRQQLTAMTEYANKRNTVALDSESQIVQLRDQVTLLREDLEFLLTCKHGEFCSHYSEAERRAKKNTRRHRTP